MTNEVLVTDVNVFGAALLAYVRGDRNVVFTIERDDGAVQQVRAYDMWEIDSVDEFDQHALKLCEGTVLDLGAGGGRHAVLLRERGLKVTALDRDAGCVEILRRRGFSDALCQSAVKPMGRTFDTILLMGNSLGMFGSLAGLSSFFSDLPHRLSDDGVLVCDSTDIGVAVDSLSLAYVESNHQRGRPEGQASYRMRFGELTTEFFDWIYPTADQFCALIDRLGLACTIVRREPNGRFLSLVAARSSTITARLLLATSDA